VSRGVVLWPDEAIDATVRAIWDDLGSRGLPSLATLTHRRHQPHVSLTGAGDLPAHEVLTAIGKVPARPVNLQVDAAGVFPGAVLFLACTANQRLLDEQRRVHEALEPLLLGPMPYSQPGAWVPHITLGIAYTADQLAAAMPVVLAHLPLRGSLSRGGVADDAGDSWTALAGSSAWMR
jgi:2'-5' RNA ligase